MKILFHWIISHMVLAFNAYHNLLIFVDFLYVGFHDRTRLKSENKKMELAITLERVDVYLSFSERIIHLPHVYPKLCLIEFRI